jgi:hypothetical protein
LFSLTSFQSHELSVAGHAGVLFSDNKRVIADMSRDLLEVDRHVDKGSWLGWRTKPGVRLRQVVERKEEGRERQQGSVCFFSRNSTHVANLCCVRSISYELTPRGLLRRSTWDADIGWLILVASQFRHLSNFER